MKLLIVLHCQIIFQMIILTPQTDAAFFSRILKALLPSKGTINPSRQRNLYRLSPHSKPLLLNLIKGYIGPPTNQVAPHVAKPKGESPLLKLTVQIPPASVNYEKDLNVKTGGQFSFTTPMENYSYSSSGKVNLRCAIIQYKIESKYAPNTMCFYLHFLTIKRDKHEDNSDSC